MIKYDKYPLYSLTSGPCDTHPEILEALSRQVLYFEDPYFVNIYKNIGLKLKTILGTKNDVILMPGEAILGLSSSAEYDYARRSVPEFG
jgi:aspartate aminotransferase-like enzyme